VIASLTGPVLPYGALPYGGVPKAVVSPYGAVVGASAGAPH
jgi:hypothetical protein